MALTPYITSKSELISYVKEGLGFPVVNVEVTDKQIHNQLDVALEKFVEFADGGAQRRFQALNIITNQRNYKLDYDVISVSRMYSLADVKLDAVFPDKLITDFYGQASRRNDLLTLELSRQYLTTLDFMLNVELQYDFNVLTKDLYLMENPTKSISVGLVYYQRTDYSDDTSLIYDHPWIKKYTTALTRRQWGYNLTKYSGTPLPTGVTLDAQSILAEAKEEIEKLDTELEEVYRFPADFFVG